MEIPCRLGDCALASNSLMASVTMDYKQLSGKDFSPFSEEQDEMVPLLFPW